MNLMPLANLIESAGLGVKGDTLFLNMLPAEVESGILLRSPLQGTPIDYELPGYYRSEFRLIVRGRDYVAADTLIGNVVTTLTLTNQTADTMRFNFCRPKTKPVSFPLSDGNLYEFAVDFEASFTEA